MVGIKIEKSSNTRVLEPGFSSIQNITKIAAYPGTEYSKLPTLMTTACSCSAWNRKSNLGMEHNKLFS
jgi:hypothetical protein